MLVDHKLRQSRLNSEAFILNNEAVADGFSPESAAVQDTHLTDGSSNPEIQPETPKCFVNIMYEDLPDIPKSD